MGQRGSIKKRNSNYTNVLAILLLPPDDKIGYSALGNNTFYSIDANLVEHTLNVTLMIYYIIYYNISRKVSIITVSKIKSNM